MNLFFHIAIHIFFGLLAGFITWRVFKNPVLSFFSTFLSGVAVDLDHFFDYFLAFGTNFRLDYFVSGYQFLKSGKVYILFHAWEYVIILIILAIILKNRKFRAVFLGLALGLFFHLAADVIINHIPPKSYSIIYRIEKNFAIKDLSYPESWEKHREQKSLVKFQQ